MPDYDARLVDLYDEDNPDGPDHDYFRALADAVDARAILDLGCGTGILTVTFARAPVARSSGSTRPRRCSPTPPAGPAAPTSTWIPGDSRRHPRRAVRLRRPDGQRPAAHPDLAWEHTLRDLDAALRVGGVLAFETRNPRVRAWESWADAEPTVRSTARGPLREWLEVSVSPNPVASRSPPTTSSRTPARSSSTSRPSPSADGRSSSGSLVAARFAVDRVHADWNRTPRAATHR